MLYIEGLKNNHMMKHNAKIVVFDIETAPAQAYIWKRWKNNVHLDQVVSEGYVLCAVAKFLNERSPRRISMLDFPHLWKKDSENDVEVVKWCWDILDEADIVVAHYGKGYDIPVLNARFITLGLPPPKPYKIVDTKEIASKYFKFPYNSLDGIGEYLKLGRKNKTDFNLWVNCMNGVKSAWKDMVDYCVQDVLLLEKVYKKLIPWCSTHPNLSLYDLTNENPVCPKCGSDSLQWRGTHRTLTQVYRRFQCKDCGGWGREKTTCLPKEKSRSVTTHAVV